MLATAWLVETLAAPHLHRDAARSSGRVVLGAYCWNTDVLIAARVLQGAAGGSCSRCR
jgi:hypothetical protein